MKIKHIFAAIELDSLDPERFSKHLVDAWRRIRFASPPSGYSGSDKIGAALIGTENFAWKSSGWFDQTGITFPAGLLPKYDNELLGHLEWMIDCRRNQDTVAYLWNSVRKMLPTHPPAHCFVKQKTLGEIAGDISRLAEDEPLLAKALLTGRLSRASALVAKKHQSLSSCGHLNTIVAMVIIWALFDLQVIAYRLFHAEWNALDAGMDSTENMTVGTLQQIARTIAEMAKRTAKAFKNRKRISELDPELRDFVLENDLVNVARQNAARLKISRTSVKDRAHEREAIAGYLQYLQGRLTEIGRVLGNGRDRRRLTLVGYAAHAAGTSKGRFRAVPLDDKKARALESKQSVATARFSLPALTALLYAAEGVVSELAKIPSGGNVVRNADGLFSGGRSLLQPKQRKNLIACFFPIYRDLFVRSGNNGFNTVSKQACERHALEAEAAIAAGLPNPGLEPPAPGWRSRNAKPLFPGVPASVLLSNGLPNARSEEQMNPKSWRPNRVAAERKAETRNVRSVAGNSKARRLFRDLSIRVDYQFGGVVEGRLQPKPSEADDTLT